MLKWYLFHYDAINLCMINVIIGFVGIQSITGGRVVRMETDEMIQEKILILVMIFLCIDLLFICYTGCNLYYSYFY